MGRVSLGFLLGAVITGLCFVLLESASDQAPTAVPEGDVSAAFEPRSPSAESVERDVAGGLPAQPERDPDTGRDFFVTELERREQEAREAWLLAREQLGVARRAAEPPPKAPIVLPFEFGWLSERSTTDWHSFAEREAIDPLWSSQTEAQINGYFAQRPGLIEKYGYPTINCRTTICEIAFVAYGLDAEPYESTEDQLSGGDYSEHFFHRDNREFFELPWVDQFALGPEVDPFLNVEVNNQDGITTILWHLIKKRD